MSQPTYDIYQQKIIDHYQQPKHQGHIDQPDHQASAENTLCGDSIEFYVSLDSQQHITHITWQGQGCAISLASADLLAEHVTGQSISQALNLTSEQWLDQLGLELRPSRIKCALLGHKALLRALGQN